MMLLFALLYLIGTADAWRSGATMISPQANTHWGTWGDTEFCPSGHYAYGFRLRVESDQGPYKDDTALNGIRLYCK